MATHQRRSDGSYQISVYLGKDPVTGKKLRTSTTYYPKAKTPAAIEKEVVVFETAFEKKVKEGEIYEGDKLTVSAVVEIWKKNWAVNNLTARVLQDYVWMLEKRVLPDIGCMIISKVKATHIDTILLKLKAAGRAEKTIKYTFTAINSVFVYAFKKSIIEKNPCERVDIPKCSGSKPDGKLKYFTLEQAQTFLNALDREYTHTVKAHTRTVPSRGLKFTIPEHSHIDTIPTQWKAYFSVAIFGGFRRGEMCALQWSDIDFEQRTISITKSFSKVNGEQIIKPPKTDAGVRKIVLPSECFSKLASWKMEQRKLAHDLGNQWLGALEDEDNESMFDQNYVFIQLDNGLPLSLDTPTHKFKEIIDMYNETVDDEEKKLPQIRLHDLRHTSATLLLANNADIATVSKRLGHSKISTTLDVYTHSLEPMDQKASDTLETLFKMA